MSDDIDFRAAQRKHGDRIKSERAVMDAWGVTRSQARLALRAFDFQERNAEAIANSTKATPYRPPPVSEVKETKLAPQGFTGGTTTSSEAGGADVAESISASTIAILDINDGGTFKRYTQVLYSGTETAL